MSIVAPFLVLAISMSGKFASRAKDLDDDTKRGRVFYETLTLGAELALISMALLFSSAIAQSKANFEASVVLLILVLVFIIPYLIIVSVESAFNKPDQAKFLNWRTGFFGLIVPDLGGIGCVAIATLLSISLS